MKLPLRDWQTQFRASLRGSAPGPGLLADSPGTPLEARLGIYREAYWTRVSGSLAEDFPLTLRLLGREEFLARVRDYLPRKAGYALELNGLSPGFADFLREAEITRGLRAAVEIDLCALESRRAAEPSSGQGAFGLHPSVRLTGGSRRWYALWRQGGLVSRERISPATRELLACFAPAAPLAELGVRLEALALDPTFVQAEVASWTGRGLIISVGQ